MVHMVERASHSSSGQYAVWCASAIAIAAGAAVTVAASFRRKKTDETTPHYSNSQGDFENGKRIQKVLMYWFGQNSPNINQKNLWMIQDPKRLRQVDQEIYEKFVTLLVELSLEDPTRWNEWCSTSTWGYSAKLAAIVVLDQFSRHIHRYIKETAVSDQTNIPSQTILDQRALSTAQRFVQDHANEMETGMIPIPMQIFALMPFRHASKLETVQFVHDKIETTLATLVEQSDDMVRRFRKATNRRLAVLQGEARRIRNQNGQGNEMDKEMFTDDDILESSPFLADLSSTKDHIVHKTICKFLASLNIFPTVDRSDQTKIHTLIVSLSGGVDSMVIAAVLADLVQAHGYQTVLRVAAVHIDYANRPESSAEASFVEQWCREKQIDFYCRRIDEVTRGITARDEYEAISRDVRYSFYTNTIQRYQNTSDPSSIGVFLGHHRGDLRENVLSNAHKGCGPLDLSGMTLISMNQGVKLYRPLLPLEKNDIFHYAHKYGVPYFKDTTPNWSTRGKLRNKLLPLLQEIYGEGCLRNLSQLAVESDDCRALVHSISLQPFLDGVENKPMGIKFATKPYKHFHTFFWKIALREALHSASLGMFSDKSTDSFLVRVQADSLKSGWLQCRRDYGVFLQGNGDVFVLFPTSFPWRPAEKYDTMQAYGNSVSIGDTAIVGPWLIETTLCSEIDNTKWDHFLKSKAFDNLDSFMTGSFSYFLAVPSWNNETTGEVIPRPLVFRKFARNSRPKAWKGLDTKIEDTLPLLGIENEDSSGSAECLVKISYRLKTSVNPQPGRDD